MTTGSTWSPHQLRAESLSLEYDGLRVIDGLDFTAAPGKVSVIVGPNASGKSTLLRGLARLMKPAGGRVLLDARDIRSIRTKRLAEKVGLLPQQPVAPEGIRVGDLVGRGRFPHQGWLRQWSSADDLAVSSALEDTDTLGLVERRVDELSGGQRQRVWIAMVLAQDPEVLLLDEPTSFLDVRHQVEVLDLLHDLNTDRGTTIVLVLHDLNLAARYADELVVMSGGRIVAQGLPAEVITAETVFNAFGMRSTIVPDPVCGSPMVIPHGRVHGAAVGARPEAD